MAKGFTEGYKTYDTSKGYGNTEQWQNSFEQRMNYKVLSNKDQDTNKWIVEPLYNCATQNELKLAYYKLMFKYHPDKAGDTEENKVIAQLINNTYFNLKTK